MTGSTFPTWSAGETITAAMLNSMIPLTATKPADTSRASTVTPTSDPDLTFSVLANGIYALTGQLLYTGAAQGSGDILAQWTAPASATFAWQGIGFSTSVTIPTAVSQPGSLANSRAFGSNGGSLAAVLVTGLLTVSTTAGTFALQWSQNTSSGTATVLKAGSWLQLTRTA